MIKISYVPNINKIKKKLNVKITYNLWNHYISTIRLDEKLISIVTPTFNEEDNIELISL